MSNVDQEMTTPSEKHPLEALTWLANGTLEGAVREKVEAHLEQCPRCREEFRFLQALRQGLRKEWQEAPGELGWARLQTAIHKERTDRAGRRLRRMAAVAGLVVLIQTGIITYLVQRAPEQPLYQPLGTQEAEAVLQVRFRPQATEAALRRLLDEAGLEIVGGPGALGIYSLRPLEPGPGALERARRRLAESPLVEEVTMP